MAVSNTSILIKRSTSTSTPTSLKAGEIAYSYLSNTFFIGTPDGTSALALGGYTDHQTVSGATAANTASTLVKRDANGAFSGRLYGDANSADQLTTSHNFSVSGGDITASAVGFNGTGDVTLNASLNNIAGLTAGTYGSATLIPIIQVAANGRIVAIQNSSSSISATSNFTISGNTGSSTFYTGNTFHVVANTGSGINTNAYTVGNDTYVSVGIDNTHLRSNTSAVGPQTISTDLAIAGNLVVTGTTTYVNTATIQTNDSLIKLAANNTVNDVVDIGFYGSSNTGSSVQFHGLIREGSGGSSAGKFYLFKNLNTDPSGNTVNYAGLSAADLIAGNLTATSLYSSNGAVSTGVYTGSYTDGIIVDYDGTNSNARLSAGAGDGFTFYNNANNSRNALLAINQYGNITTGGWTANTIGTGYGGTGLTSFTSGGAVYATSTSALTTGTLPVASGGTGATSFTPGSHIIYNGSTFTNLANSSYSTTNSFGAAQTISSVSVDSYGRLTNITTTGIAISAGAVSGLAAIATSGNATDLNLGGFTLGAAYGGTGLNTITTNGITYGNGTAAVGVTAAAGTSDQTWSNQILTVTNAGVPVWSSAMDGGTF